MYHAHIRIINAPTFFHSSDIELATWKRNGREDCRQPKCVQICQTFVQRDINLAAARADKRPAVGQGSDWWNRGSDVVHRKPILPLQKGARQLGLARQCIHCIYIYSTGGVLRHRLIIKMMVGWVGLVTCATCTLPAAKRCPINLLARPTLPPLCSSDTSRYPLHTSLPTVSAVRLA